MSLTLFFFFVPRLRPMGLSVLGYQSHVLKCCHPACGHEASSYLTLSATGARIKYLVLLRIELTTPHYYSDLRGCNYNNSSTRAKKADRAYVVMRLCRVDFQVVYSTTWRAGSNVMMPNTLQQGGHLPSSLGYTRTHS